MTKQPKLYTVVEYSEDEPIEQVLTLDTDGHLPTGGILNWRSDMECGALFGSRSAARDAIIRTEHYRLAFGLPLPEKQNLKIVSMRVGGVA